MSWRPGRKGKVALGAIGVVAIVAAVVVFLGGTAVVVTSQPEFCASCHLMETRYVSWKRSSHEGVTNCLTCHSEPGFVNEMKAHIAATRYLWVMATGNRTGPIIHGEAPSSACLECHPADDRLDVVPELALDARGHTPAHKAHRDFGVECTDCHYRPSLHGEETLVPMQVCVDCHTERTIVSPSCQTCHEGPLGQPVRVGQRQ